MTEDEMVGWHHQLSGPEFEQAPRDGRQGAWHAAVHGVAKSQTQLSDRTELMWGILAFKQPQCEYNIS